MNGPLPSTQRIGARMGLFGATMVGVGAMVGAGIFVLAGVAMRVSGPAAILAFALNGLVTLVTAFSFAELSSTFPESGGGYVFAKKVFPISGAFTAGWVLWFAYVVAAALYALGFAGFLGYGIEELGAPGLPAWFEPTVAVAVALGVAALLALKGANLGDWISFAKLVAFVVIIAAGLIVLGGRPEGTVRAAMVPFLPFGLAGVAAAMGFTFIALEGFEVIAAVGEEVRDPARTIPRAMFLSIGITLVVYLGLLFVVLTVGGPADGTAAWRDLGGRAGDAIAVAAQRFGGAFGGALAVLAGLLSTLSALVATLLAASRVSFSMARDRALPRALSALRGQAPLAALAVSGGLVALVVAVTGNVETAGAAASLVFLLSFALANAAGLLVRSRAAALAVWRAPLYPFLPLVGITLCLGLALFQTAVAPAACLVVAAWLAGGALLYVFWLRRSARTVSALAETWDQELARLRGRTPLVLVPLANPERAEPLMRLAHALAPAVYGRVLALAVAPHRRSDDPEAGVAAYERAQLAIHRAVEASCGLGRPFESTVLLAPEVAPAIRRVAAERHPETVLLGMSNMGLAGGADLLQEILGGTDSDVVVLNAPADWSLESVRRVLVPFAGGSPHDPLRARMLGMLMREGTREATLLHVLGAGQDRERARRQLVHAAEDLGLPRGSGVLEEPADPLAVILRYAVHADLVVLGFEAGAGRRRLLGSFALEVVAGAPCPVVAIAQADRSRFSRPGGRTLRDQARL